MNYLKITAVIFLIGVTYSFAQSSETKEKLKNLKGDVTKITVETTEGKVELTGEDAEAIFKKIKSASNNNFVFVHGGESDKEISVSVDVEDIDGDKVVVIKKKVDGKETVEKYKGEEAEKFIKEHGGDTSNIHVIVTGDDDDFVWVTENKKGVIEQNVNVEVEDGVKKVTVTTIKDGNKNVEIYEGEEAEKYLEEMDEGKADVFIDKDGNKTIIKKKIIIIEEDDDKDND